MNKKWLLLLASCLIGLGCGMFFVPKHKTSPDKEVYVVATNAEFAPFTFVEDQRIVGFDIDIAREVCTRLGKEMKLKDMPFEALIPDLTLGHVHFAAAGMSYTKERAERVLFTKSYLNDDPLVILTLHEVSGLEDLFGKTVVVNEGFTADLFMSSKSGYTLVRLPTTTDGFLALKTGRADAFITAKNTVKAFLSKHSGEGFCIKDIPDTAQTCALVISKKYPELLPEIQKALDAMTADGTLTAIKEKWGVS